MAERRRQSHLTRPLFLSLYLPTFLMAASTGLLLPVLPVFASGLGSSWLMIGVILAGEALGMLLADIPAGLAIRRLGMRSTMFAGLVLAGGSVLLLTLTTDPGTVVLLRLSAGIGVSLFNLSRHVFMAAGLGSASRGRATALFGGTTRFGMLLGPLLGGFIAGRSGLSAAFLCYGLFTAAALVLCWRFVDAQRSPAARAGGTGSVTLLRELLGSEARNLLPAGLGQLCAQALRQGRLVLIPLVAANLLALPVETVGLIAGAAAAADFSLFYVAGLIMDRHGRKWAIVPSFLIQGLALLLLPFVWNAGSLLAVALAGGFGNGIGSGTMMTLGMDLAPTGRQGEFLGLWRFIGDSGGMSGPLLVGALAQALSLPASAVIIACLGLGGSLLFARFVPETLRPRPEAGTA